MVFEEIIRPSSYTHYLPVHDISEDVLFASKRKSR